MEATTSESLLSVDTHERLNDSTRNELVQDKRTGLAPHIMLSLCTRHLM